MSFYIGVYGHVYEHGGKPSEKEPPIADDVLGFTNSFEDKERAFYFRDRLRDANPRIFTKVREPKASASSNKVMSQEDFREQMRLSVANRIDEFWQNMAFLKHKDYVDAWLKAAAFGFSKAPTEREMDEEEKQKQAMKESKRRADLIRRGIQTEDMED